MADSSADQGSHRKEALLKSMSEAGWEGAAWAAAADAIAPTLVGGSKTRRS